MGGLYRWAAQGSLEGISLLLRNISVVIYSLTVS